MTTRKSFRFDLAEQFRIFGVPDAQMRIEGSKNVAVGSANYVCHSFNANQLSRRSVTETAGAHWLSTKFLLKTRTKRVR